MASFLFILYFLSSLIPLVFGDINEHPDLYRIQLANFKDKRFFTGSIHKDFVLTEEGGCLDVLDQAVRNKQGNCNVLDVGMNDGFYTQLATTYGCHVWSFELQSSCIALSRNATIANNASHLVNFIHAPASARNGEPLKVPHGTEEDGKRCDGGFSIAGGDANLRAHKPYSIRGYHILHTIRLDSFVPVDTKIDFLKVDVEGHDPEVLEGAELLFKEKRIQFAVVEVFVDFWSVPQEEAFLVYERIYNYGYQPICVTERKGNIYYEVVAKNITFAQFRRYATDKICINWEFHPRS